MIDNNSQDGSREKLIEEALSKYEKAFNGRVALKEKLLKEKKEAVLNLLSMGLNEEQISKALNLALEEIKDIIKSK